MLGKGIVTTIVSRYGHDGASTISCQDIFGNIDGNPLVCQWVDGIRAREDTRNLVIHLTLTFRALLHVIEIVLHRCFLLRSCQLLNQFTLGCQDHEGHTEDGVGTGGEDRELDIRVGNTEFHLRSFRTTNPVALGFFQGVGPVDGIQTIQQSLSIGRDAEAPLAHLLLNNGEATTHTHTVNHLIIGQYST